MKTLVAYFSVSGNTKKIAQELAQIEGADLYEIVPAKAYTAEDLDWKNKESRTTKEMSDPNCRPELAGEKLNMDEYDTIFLGFPLWWEREPSVVDTFLTSYNFEGKIIFPFCTSGGSAMKMTCERINNLLERKAKVAEGKRLGGDISKEDLKLWSDGVEK